MNVIKRMMDRDWDPAPVTGWMLREGRFEPDGNVFLARLGERLVAAGAPVSRLRLSARMLHPLYTGWTSVWEIGGTVERNVWAPHGLEQRAGYQGSPMAIAAETGQPFRRRLDHGLDASDHPVLHEFAARGMTDYLAIPMRFLGGRGGVIVFSSTRDGGFKDGDVAAFEDLVAVLGPIVNTAALLNLAQNVAAAYIGPRSGARVLDGRIERGDVEILRAAVWFSDLHGWSRLANTLPAADAIALANDYFELTEAAITAHGGEVLKLIGDAVLATFLVEDGEDEAACARALGAAREAQRQAANETRSYTFGVGLNLGEIVYGNVGAPTRLDFTVMGQAVNLAARIEKLTRTLGKGVILSEDFAAVCPGPCRDLGTHDIAGWDVPVRVFAAA